jgi:excinuclease UvrABC nuclease subunit
MTKATLKYDLNELDDKIDFERAAKAKDLVFAVDIFKEKLNTLIKNTYDEERQKSYEQVRELFIYVMDEFAINIEALVGS